MAQPTQTDPQFKLRLPASLKQAIETAAAANNRSMNAEIVRRLEAYGDGEVFDYMARQRDMINQLAQASNLLEKNKNLYKDLLKAERRITAGQSVLINMLVDLILRLEDKVPEDLIVLASRINLLLHRAEDTGLPVEEISLEDIIKIDEWNLLQKEMLLRD